MKVIVTGAAGFIGAHSCKALIERDCQVVGVDCFTDFHPREMKDRRYAALVGASSQLFEFDVADDGKFEQLVANFRPDAVLHLAAQAGVRYSMIHPERCLRSNVLGTFKVFEAAARHGVSRVVYASSSSVYGGSQGVCREDDASIVPLSLYGASKRSDELIARTFWESDHLRTVGARFFTTYGEWGRPDMAYFRLLVSALSGTEFPLLADLNVTRDFTYIEDLVHVLVELLERADSFEDPSMLINVGGGSPSTLSTLIRTVEDLTGKKVNSIAGRPTPGDVMRTEASTDRLASLGLPLPRMALEEGIALTLDWIAPLIDDAVRWARYSSSGERNFI